MLNLLLVGANGQMGQRVQTLAKKDFNLFTFDIVGEANFSSFDDINEKIDVVLDFSSPRGTSQVVNFCKSNLVPLVSAVTGHNEVERKELESLSKYVAVLHSGNFSTGINVINKILKTLTKDLIDYDVEIIESHHNLKKDVPSGTCKMFVNTIKSQRDLKETYRDETSGKREKDEIGIHSIRGGSVVGEHSVLFLGNDEIIEIKHTALSKNVFVPMALKVCEWIVNKEKRLYSLSEYLLDENSL